MSQIQNRERILVTGSLDEYLEICKQSPLLVELYKGYFNCDPKDLWSGSCLFFMLVSGDMVVAACHLFYNTDASLVIGRQPDVINESSTEVVRIGLNITDKVIVNLVRNPMPQWKGYGMKLVKYVLKEMGGPLLITSKSAELRRYYVRNGFHRTNLFDRAEGKCYRLFRSGETRASSE